MGSDMHTDVRDAEGKLKGRGKTWLVAVGLLLAAWLAAAAPARAEHLEWQGVSVPQASAVDFQDVAASPEGIVVAVGSSPAPEESAAGTVAQIRRRPAANSAWVADTVADPLNLIPAAASQFTLTSVAVKSGLAWAVGTYSHNGPQPLLLSLSSPNAVDAQSWTVIDKPTGMTTPTSVALSRTIDDFGGLIGDSSGKVFPISGMALGNGSSAATPTAAVTGMAFSEGTSAFVVGSRVSDPSDLGEASKARIYTAAYSGENPTLGWTNTVATPDPRSFEDVASLSQSNAVAIESGTDPRLWEPTGPLSTWERRSAPLRDQNNVAIVTSTSQFHDLAMVDDAPRSPLLVVVGRETAPGLAPSGYVWQRRGGNWTRETRSANPLNGVAVVSPQELFAVGNSGVVQRLALGEHQGIEGNGGNGGGGGGEQLPSVNADSQNEEQPPDNGEPGRRDPKPCVKPQLKGQNVRDIEVRNRRRPGTDKGNLFVRFRLRKAARVQILALSGRKVVGKTPQRLLDRGKHVLRLRYRKPPQKVRIKAKLASSCDKTRRNRVAYVARDTKRPR